MAVRFTINSSEFDKEIKQSLSRKNSAKAIQDNLKTDKGELIVNKIEKMKKEMISDFLRLPVTREILAGPKSTNISGTLGGYGNLFSFIGFSEGDKPIDPIVLLLSQTNFRVTRFNAAGRAQLIIEIPSKEQIFKATPLPWASGISWAQRIEIGMSGLGTYLNTSSDKSRSGSGVQANKKIRTGRFSNTSYISQFLNKWQKAFLAIDKDVSIRKGL
jgi:hypothetical protein